MAGLYEKLVEVIGDESKAKEVQSSLGEFMLPRTEHAKTLEKLKQKEEELESIRTAGMGKEEALQHEIEKLKKSQAEFGIKTNRIEAERLFVSAGLSQEVYGELLDKTVSEDKEKTLSVAQSFVEILKKEKESVAKKTQEELINSTKKPAAGNSSSTGPEQITIQRTL